MNNNTSRHEILWLKLRSSVPRLRFKILGLIGFGFQLGSDLGLGLGLWLAYDVQQIFLANKTDGVRNEHGIHVIANRI